MRGRGRRRDKGVLMAEEGSGADAAAPDREVLLISAGASHSVALLCEFEISFLDLDKGPFRDSAF